MLIVKAVDWLPDGARLQGLRNEAGKIAILVDRRHRWRSRRAKWMEIAEMAAELDRDTPSG